MELDVTIHAYQGRSVLLGLNANYAEPLLGDSGIFTPLRCICLITLYNFKAYNVILHQEFVKSTDIAVGRNVGSEPMPVYLTINHRSLLSSLGTVYLRFSIDHRRLVGCYPWCSAAECRACELGGKEIRDLESGKGGQRSTRGRMRVGSFARANIRCPQAKEAKSRRWHAE